MALPSIPSPIFDRNKKRMNLFQPSGAAPSNGILRSPVEELNLDALTPQLENVYLEDLIPRQPTAQQLFQQAMNMRAQQGREAVDLRRQELRELGRLGYEPLADRAVADRVLLDRLPGEQGALLPFEGPTTVRQVPGIGTAFGYEGYNGDKGARAMVGRYGTGVAVQRDKPDPDRKIEGIPAAEWFKRAASSQGADNKYARAETTGKTDELGRPQMQGVAIPTGSDARTERIMDAMKKGSVKNPEAAKEVASTPTMVTERMPNVAYSNHMSPEQSLSAARDKYARTGDDSAIREHFKQFPSEKVKLYQQEKEVWDKVGENVDQFFNAMDDRMWAAHSRDQRLKDVPYALQGAADELYRTFIPQAYTDLDKKVPRLDFKLIQKANELNKKAQSLRS